VKNVWKSESEPFGVEIDSILENKWETGRSCSSCRRYFALMLCYSDWRPVRGGPAFARCQLGSAPVPRDPKKKAVWIMDGWMLYYSGCLATLPEVSPCREIFWCSTGKQVSMFPKMMNSSDKLLMQLQQHLQPQLFVFIWNDSWTWEQCQNEWETTERTSSNILIFSSKVTV